LRGLFSGKLEVAGRVSEGRSNHAHALTGKRPLVDMAPAVLWILGLKPPVPLDGRVLTEGLSIEGPKLKAPRTKRLNATRDLGRTTWKQYLEISELNGVTYIHEGNGRAETKPPKP
jgi:hypothetical protein